MTLAAVAGAALALAGPASAVTPSPLLYDQTATNVQYYTFSQDDETKYNSFDDQAADDFVVPAGKTWKIDQVEVDGEYVADCAAKSAGPAASVNVFVYADNNGLPGTQRTSFSHLPYTNGANFTVKLPESVALPAGRYWLSVQARQDCGTAGDWGWHLNPTTKGNVAAYRNPGNGYETGCTTYKPFTTCFGAQYGNDLSFRLRGTDAAVVVDKTPPTCVVTSTTTTVPKKQTVRVSDAGSGLASINGVTITNGTTALPVFAQGASSADVVTTKTDQSKKTVYSFTATDVAGNSTRCQ